MNRGPGPIVHSSFTFHACGHPAVLSTHPSTIEITKEGHLSRTGDCIVAVNSSMGPADIPEDLRIALAQSGAKVLLVLRLGRFEFVAEGEGDPRLTLTHLTDFVIRKSGFISDRTLMIHSNKAASDLPRGMVRMLKDSRNKVRVEISAKAPG